MEPFRGTEALSAARLTRHGLTARHRRLLPDVYAPLATPLSLQHRITAAWLWSARDGVVSGLSAAALHGSLWVPTDAPVELNHPHNKSPAGVVARRDTLLPGEIVHYGDIAVTSVARTAFDLARRGTVTEAMQRLDALAAATRFSAAEVLAVRENHPRVRGRRRVPQLLALVDPKAQSPKETWLRLVLIRAGFPPPRTQIPVPWPDGDPRYFLDMGWEEYLVAAEYDGQQHRTDPVQYRKDVERAEYVRDLGWRNIRVLAGHRAENVVARVEAAGVHRGPPRFIG